MAAVKIVVALPNSADFTGSNLGSFIDIHSFSGEAAVILQPLLPRSFLKFYSDLSVDPWTKSSQCEDILFSGDNGFGIVYNTILHMGILVLSVLLCPVSSQ